MIHHPIFEIPHFDHVTTKKLAYYYIVGQRAMLDLQGQTNPTNLTPI